MRSRPGEPPKPGKKSEPSPLAGAKNTQRKWWEEEDSLGQQPLVIQLISTLVQQNGGAIRRQSLLNWFRLYINSFARGLSAGSYASNTLWQDSRLTFNIVKSAVDTMVARTTEKTPKASFLTSNGTYSEQKKAKGLTDFVEGIFYENQFSQKTAPAVVSEAYIFGTGADQVYENEDGRVAIEKVFLEELIVDDMEAMYGKPRSIHRYKMLPRDVVRGMFEGNEAAQKLIDEAPVANVDAERKQWAMQSDLILVVESWHIPSGKIPKIKKAEEVTLRHLRKESFELRSAIEEGVEYEGDAARIDAIAEEIDTILRKGHDGRHAMFVENGVLCFEAWRKKWFPFAVTHWTEPKRGFANGIGIAEELAEIQYQITQVCTQISEALAFCVPKVMVSGTAGIVQDHIDDIAMSILVYQGERPPELLAWDAIPPVLFTHLETLIRRGYDLIGVSEMSANAQKPTDLESGAALRTFDDLETGRHFTQGAAQETFYLDTARLVVRVGREIAEKNDGHYIVRTPHRRKAVREIDWADVNLDEDAFIMQCFPTSALPRTPAGRLAMVNDLMTRGFLAKEDAVRLLDFPDLDAVNEIVEAAAEFTSWQIERMLEYGEQQQPEPYQNLAYALTHAQAAYLTASTRNTDKKCLEYLRTYIESVKDLAVKAQQPAVPPGEEAGIPGGPPTTPAPGEPQAAPVAGGAPSLGAPQ